MKKIISMLLSMVMIVSCTMIVSAAPQANSKKTTETKTEFYIQRFGVHMDEEGSVSSRDKAYFTPLVYTAYLTPGRRDTDYTVVYKEGEVSSDDVISEIEVKPNNNEIFQKIKAKYENNGYILSSSGKVVDWSNFTTDNYDIRWYVLKLEDIWHVDGVIIEKETDLPIEIPAEGDEGYIPPEDVENNGEEDDDAEIPELPQYTSNFAYIFGYNDTTMAAEEPLLRSEVSAMIYRLVKQNNKLGGFVYDESATPVFSDIGGKWFRSAIEYMNYKNAFDVNEGDAVYPSVPVTRGEAFKLICIGLGFTDDTDLSLDDYAQIMFNAGYIQGDENGNLNVDKMINRAEFCTIYNRVIDREDALLITDENEKVTAATYGFTDLEEGKWYYDEMLKATSAYDDNGYVDMDLRGIRNDLDDYR